MMLFRFVTFSALLVLATAQNCGPSYNGQVCASGNCCSQYGWCDTDAAHCDPETCLSTYSGPGSSCAKLVASSISSSTLRKSTTSKKPTITGNTTSKATSKTSSKSTSKTTTTKPSPSSTTIHSFASAVPNIDVCGAASNNISCPGAGFGGLTGYFYRCCSTAGHCGPKNNIQEQSLYCGSGCQPGYGKCDSEVAPPNPTGTPGVAQAGDTCGPIVNMKCASGLCCSGSNYCGTGTDFCGSANWCQKDFGECDS